MNSLENGAQPRRGNPPLESFFYDVRFGARLLRKSPGFTAVAVLTLALGIGANTAVFSVVERLLLRPLPYPNPQGLVQISNSYLPNFTMLGLSPGDYQDWKRQARSFSQMGAYVEVSQGMNLSGAGDPQRVVAAYATSSLFPTLGVLPLAGRTFSADDDKPSGPTDVLLTERFWRTRFAADPAVVGRNVTLDGRGFTVVGILPARSHLVSWPDVWLPIGQYFDDLNEHVHHGFATIARINP